MGQPSLLSLDSDEVKLKLNVRKFAGLTCRYPMERDDEKQLDFVVIHHGTRTEAGYEVVLPDITAQFYNLNDAISFYNEV